MKDNQTRSSRLLLAIFVGLMACFCIIAAIAHFRRPAATQNFITARSPDLREALFDFSASNMFIRQDGRVSVLSVIECDEGGGCVNKKTGGNPSLAWAIPMLAQSKHDFSTSNVPRLQKASALLNDIFLAWVGSADSYAERYSLHQMFEASRVTGDSRFIFWLNDRRSLLRMYADQSIAHFKSTQRSFEPSYIVSTLAREIGLLASNKVVFSKSQEDESIIFNPGAVALPTDLDRQDLERVNRLLEIARHDYTSGGSSSYPPMFQDNQTKISQMACFEHWALAATLPLVEAGAPPQEAERPSYKSRSLAKLIQFFAQLRDIPDDKLNFTMQQGVLPCIAAAGELREFLINAPEVIPVMTSSEAGSIQISGAELTAIIRRLFLRSLDHYMRLGEVCKFPQGITARLDFPPAELKCGSEANLTDISWLHSLLGRWAPDEVFAIERQQ